jgi:ABC-2 type transport system ATP-binding protein
MIISLQNISHRFDQISALDNVSINVKEGEMFGLVGPDGAGKSTLIRIVLGILKKQHGDVLLFGKDAVADTSLVKNRIGYLSQQFSLYEDLSIDENIEFFARIHNVQDYEARRNELLAFTRLTPFRDRLAGKLSGGMKQKLALACTLIHKPDIIFLDEPTTGVDPISRRDFWKILSDLLKQGLTIFLTTPYMDEAERCHTVALINKGKILSVNSPDHLKNEMGFEVLEFIPADSRKTYQLLKLKMPEYHIQLLGERIQMLFKMSAIKPLELTGRLKSLGIEFHSERIMKPGMENVFIYYMDNR